MQIYHLTPEQNNGVQHFIKNTKNVVLGEMLDSLVPGLRSII